MAALKTREKKKVWKSTMEKEKMRRKEENRNRKGQKKWEG